MNLPKKFIGEINAIIEKYRFELRKQAGAKKVGKETYSAELDEMEDEDTYGVVAWYRDAVGTHTITLIGDETSRAQEVLGRAQLRIIGLAVRAGDTSYPPEVAQSALRELMEGEDKNTA